MFSNHGLSPAYAKATAGRRTALINARPGRARSPSAPHWLVTVCSFFALALTSFAADPGITVSAQQRYPWNGLVDVHFTITGDAGTKYYTSFTAKDMVGNTNIAMRTIRKSNGVAAAETEQLLPGSYSWVWDTAADLPKGFKCNRVRVAGMAIDAFPYSVKFNANGGTGTMANESFTYGTAKELTANAFKRTGYTFQGWATSASGEKVYNDKQSVSNLTQTSGAVVNLYAVWKSALYMVVDLSSGSSSTSYPVSYLDAVPSGGWGNTYKTTKLVLRRCEAGTFKMQKKSNVILTKPFYIGVFEVTQKQYKQVMGTNPSNYTGDKRPVDNISYNTIRGTSNGAKWPSSSAVDSSSFMGKFRSRTGFGFDLPTEAQWEYACRAGTSSSYNNGGSAESDLKKVGRYFHNQSDGKGGYSSDHTTVGSYTANAWGLYDMHGNVIEWCLDWHGTLAYGTDPKGVTAGQADSGRVMRGGNCYYEASNCTSFYRGIFGPSALSGGIRLCLTLSN